MEYVKTPLDFNTESRSKDLAENQTTNTISQYVTWCPSTFSCEIPRENVVIEKIIGKGAFGQVAKATVIGLRGRTQATLVAVKNIKRCDLLVVTRMDTLKSGWTPYDYYATLHSIPRYTIFIRIYWGHFLEKWENQSTRLLCKEKG